MFSLMAEIYFFRSAKVMTEETFSIYYNSSNISGNLSSFISMVRAFCFVRSMIYYWYFYVILLIVIGIIIVNESE